ncbi:MAG TPA: alcohol dehydrogenase catalytic domain-containing protein [Thermoanaerobaculaceae bacterium]|nr:alcohol dehydrogenase catalytic domain-containing protein [Thermoanaerobaculaceae bacterium]HPS76829.1 alcohol dehydrogenase catalytic domain-containing protein [Thermoanaerobaculaceae bacterium]
MRAILMAGEPVVRDDLPRPEVPPGEALIRLTRAGICNTDIEILRGYRSFRGVLGHEFVGVVEAFGDTAVLAAPPRVVVGDRVVGEINCVAPESASRDARARAQDPMRTTLGIAGRDGCFADYTVLPVANLHRVPDGVGDDEAVFAEPLAAACRILEQVAIAPGARVVVLGDGKLGLLCAQVVAASGPCEVTVVGRHAAKLDVARGLGIRAALEAEVGAAAGHAADLVVECTGSPTGFGLARHLVRPRGTVLLKSTFHRRSDVDLTMMVVDEITVVGSRCGPFDVSLRFLDERRIEVRSLIHARYPLGQGVEALAHAQRPGVLKVLLDIS